MRDLSQAVRRTPRDRPVPFYTRTSLSPEKAMLHCDLRVRWKVASDLRFRAAVSEPKIPSFCGISGDLSLSTRKSLGRPVCSFNFKTKNGPKNDPKLPRKILSLVLLCRISHRRYSKIFHREFPHKIKYFFTTRICRHGHAKNR